MLNLNLIQMEVKLAKYFDYRQCIIVPNISWGFDIHECDLFVIHANGWADEVEIKLSRADLLADFKKRHAHQDKSHRIHKFYYAVPDYLLHDVLTLIPAHAGILVCKVNKTKAYKVRDAGVISDSRKLTQDEIFKVTKLGCMRVWRLRNMICKLKN